MRILSPGYYNLALKKKLITLSVCSALGLTLGASFELSAQNLGVTIDSSTLDNQERFGPVFFMQYEPQTLYQLLEYIPDVNSVLSKVNRSPGLRGFGSSGDQILINSKRVSGKENSLRKELDNIQAKDVEYVELIRGSRPDLDVQSEGLVVNVVLKDEVSSSVLWSLGTIKPEGKERANVGSVSYSSSHNDLKYRVGLELFSSPNLFSNVERFSNLDNETTDVFNYARDNNFKRPTFTSKLEYQHSPSTSIQLNASYKTIFVDANFDIVHENLLEKNESIRGITYDYKRDSWEISGDVSHKIDENNHLKLLFIANNLDGDDQTQGTLSAPGNLPQNKTSELSYSLPRLYQTKENVIRGNWKHKLDDVHSFDSGLELAINERDENLQFIDETDNQYHSIELNDIKETRYEAFVNYNYTISSDLNLQSSLIYESSTMDVATNFSLIADSNDNGQNNSSRTFDYLKPRINLRYDLSDIQQLRFNYERTVSQLSLRDFVPRFNRDETRLEETNPNLQPEVRDKLSVSFEKQWLSTDGSITLTPYYHKISDLITEIPLISYSGLGNIADGKEYGIKVDTSFGLDALGLENTLITAHYTLRDSEMEHPFTNEKTSFNRFSDRQWRVKLNHKFDKDSKLSGLSYSLTVSKNSDQQIARYDYIAENELGPRASAYIDYQIGKNLKVRLKGDSLLQAKFSYDRTRYSGLYTDSEFLRYEQRDYIMSPRYSLTLSGQF